MVQQQGSGRHTMGNRVGCAGMDGGLALALGWAPGGVHKVDSRRMGYGSGF